MSFGDVDERGTSAVGASIGLGRMLQQAQRADPPANLVSTQATIRVDSVRRGAEKVNTTKTVTSAKENRTNSTLSKDTALQDCSANETAAWTTMKNREVMYLNSSGNWTGSNDDPINVSVMVTVIYSTVGISDPEKHFWNCTIYHFDTNSDLSVTKTEFCAGWDDYQSDAAACQTNLDAWNTYRASIFSKVPSLSGRPLLAIVLAICLDIFW